MKRLIYISMLTALCGSVFAGITDGYDNREYRIFKDEGDRLYCEKINIYKIRTDKSFFDPGYFTYTHCNPVLQEDGLSLKHYKKQRTVGNVVAAKLKIVVDDLDKNDSVRVSVKDKFKKWVTLGYLNTMSYTDPYGIISGPESKPGHKTTTVFDIDPELINVKLPVVLKLSGNFFNPNQVEIESSTLCVKTIPLPGALLLGSAGCVIAGFLKRRRAI